MQHLRATACCARPVFAMTAAPRRRAIHLYLMTTCKVLLAAFNRDKGTPLLAMRIAHSCVTFLA
ncbi:hypothetical protein [Xanthomonas nasturtii]|uniref:hypothetical protein n=1 Tax=Xanthomonas nasturtii TaxID=1843581 RepID=UPI0020112327|nr:hypothetical protein [Xanthomonas nasturtii]MCL1498511.1 hypothetical protein [Xanthomonas nasturtii]MCL1502005.1 hypothetical protein [Xanthomonas nasturtii]MCL1521639.1 hypothetical protein [Xanthomonas nasturtii]